MVVPESVVWFALEVVVIKNISLLSIWVEQIQNLESCNLVNGFLCLWCCLYGVCLTRGKSGEWKLYFQIKTLSSCQEMCLLLTWKCQGSAPTNCSWWRFPILRCLWQRYQVYWNSLHLLAWIKFSYIHAVLRSDLSSPSSSLSSVITLPMSMSTDLSRSYQLIVHYCSTYSSSSLLAWLNNKYHQFIRCQSLLDS